MILDTFYLLFKSDTKQASDGIVDLEKKISSLATKGKNRTDEESKALKEAVQQYKSLTEEIKKTNNQYDSLVSSAIQAATTLVSLNSLKNGLFDAAKTNSNLAVQSKLWGQNAVEVKAWSAAVEQAGGTAQGFQSDFQGMFQRYAAAGLRLPDIDKVFNFIREKVKTHLNNPELLERAFQHYGITDPGTKSILSLKNDADFQAAIAKNKELAANAEKGSEAARHFEQEWSKVKTSLDAVFTTIDNDLLPSLDPLLKATQDFFDYLKDNKGVAEATFGVVAVAIPAISAAIIGSLVPAMGALSAVTAPLLGAVGILGGAGVLGGAFAKAAPGAAMAFGLGGAANNTPNKYSSMTDHILNGSKGANESSSIPKNKARLMADYDKEMESGGWTPPYAKGLQDLNKTMKQAQDSLSLAGSSNFSTSSVNNVGGARNITLGDIHVTSSAPDAKGLATDIRDNWQHQIRAALSNLDDGVAR